MKNVIRFFNVFVENHLNQKDHLAYINNHA